jgi:hypothetical protein
MVRMSDFKQLIIPLVIQLICEVEDDNQRVTNFSDPETFNESLDADNTINDASAMVIDRLRTSLGGSNCLLAAIPVIE